MVSELMSWFKKFNSYRKGADAEAWISIFDGDDVKVNRMTRTDRLDKTFATVCGGIQPDVVKELANGSLDKNGFLFRFLFVFAGKNRYRSWGEIKSSFKRCWEI